MPLNRPARPPCRCWLILAHCFNMDGRAASQTITDKLPWLMARGIAPVVISAPTGTRDRRFAHYQVFSPAPSGLLFELRQCISRRFAGIRVQKALKAVLTVVLLPFYLLEKICIGFDSQWSWFVTAVLAGVLAIRRHRPELIYSSAGPPSTHLAGWVLAKILNLPWIAEVHDPLIQPGQEPPTPHYHFKKWIESAIFAQAAAVIYFTHAALDQAKARHAARGGLRVIRPGADPPAGDPVAHERGDSIHLGHFGSLTPERHLAPLLAALAALPEGRDRFRVHIYGGALDPVSRRAAQDGGLQTVLVEHGRLEHDPITGKSGRRQVFEAMGRCDVLVLVHGAGAATYIPSKVYEYLMAGRPILALTPAGTELAGLLAGGSHWVVAPHDGTGLQRALTAIVAAWTGSSLESSGPSLFSVRSAVDGIVTIADEILAGGRLR